MVNKVYKVSSTKEGKAGSKHNQILMSIVGKLLLSLFYFLHTVDGFFFYSIYMTQVEICESVILYLQQYLPWVQTNRFNYQNIE